MYEPYALFPFEKVPANARVIIYGAGRAGLNFARQAGNSGYCRVVAFVDTNEKKHNKFTFGLDKLLETESYDYVIISLINFAVRKRIKDNLITFGVPAEKIIVPNDSNLLYWSLDGMMQYSENSITVREYDAVETGARSLVSSDRLDIGIKWLLMRDIMNNTNSETIRSLYARHIYAWTQGREGFMPTSGRIKDGIDEYVECARKTLESITINKYDKQYAVPLSSDNEPLDGVHRIAACIEADEKIWVQRRPGLKPEIKDYKWYLENGFTTEDMQRIYRAYCDLYTGKYAIAVLYGPAENMWDFMVTQLAKKINLVGYVDLNFESNYIAFENIINDMYFYKWQYGSKEIRDKISTLKLAPLKMRVIVLSDENDRDADIYGILREFKDGMRQSTVFDFNNIELQIHSSDTEFEAQNLCHVLLSPNNLKYASVRFRQDYRKDFIESLTKFKKTMHEKSVPLENVCLINSCSMEVMGLRDSKEVDFICLEENFGELSDLSANIYVRDNKESKDGLIELSCEYYSADKARRLILDDDCYFMFNGLKFLNLEYVREKKVLNDRQKDRNDIRLIDLFNEMSMVYDSKTALKKGIFEEIKKRRINNT